MVSDDGRMGFDAGLLCSIILPGAQRGRGFDEKELDHLVGHAGRGGEEGVQEGTRQQQKQYDAVDRSFNTSLLSILPTSCLRDYMQ
jgi:hypothetical protein